MRIEHPAKTVAEALGAALYQDLSDIAYKRWTPTMKRDGVDREDAPTAHRRPSHDEVELTLFPETWGSTALGYGGMGGAAMTPAYTAIIACIRTQEACVYWGCGRLGLKIDLTNTRHRDALQSAIEERDTHGLKRAIEDQAA